jgi:raffinose/stachyose/melibiose transport system permease protein
VPTYEALGALTGPGICFGPLTANRQAPTVSNTLDFVGTWNEYAMATTLLQSQANWTIPLAVQGFSLQYGTDYGALNAFVFMSAVPVLIVYLLFQRYFVSGALSGAVKG